MGAFIFDSNRNEWLEGDKNGRKFWTRHFNEAYEFKNAEQANNFAIAYFGENEEIHILLLWLE